MSQHSVASCGNAFVHDECGSHRADGPESADWAAYGIPHGHVRDWRRLGVSPKEASAWDMPPMFAQEWLRAGFRANEAHGWGRLYLGADDARALVDRGFDPTDILSWYCAGAKVNGPLLVRWADTGLDGSDVRLCIAAGLTPDEAIALQDLEAVRTLAALRGPGNSSR